ncbi:MAG: dodecin [Candidatus Promineifilaceae bacterium]|nr:dodecin [Candidatus Promineifilaceae bacterium]
MDDHVYKKVEIVGTSTSSVEEAIQNAVTKASESIHNLRWFEVVEVRGTIDGNQVEHYQATLKIGFTVD